MWATRAWISNKASRKPYNNSHYKIWMAVVQRKARSGSVSLSSKFTPTNMCLAAWVARVWRNRNSLLDRGKFFSRRNRTVNNPFPSWSTTRLSSTKHGVINKSMKRTLTLTEPMSSSTTSQWSVLGVSLSHPNRTGSQLMEVSKSVCRASSSS